MKHVWGSTETVMLLMFICIVDLWGTVKAIVSSFVYFTSVFTYLLLLTYCKGRVTKLLLHRCYNLYFVGFHCTKCLKKFNTKSSLQAHLRIDCGKARNKKCILCGYATSRTHNLKRHFLTIHGEEMTKYSEDQYHY